MFIICKLSCLFGKLALVMKDELNHKLTEAVPYDLMKKYHLSSSLMFSVGDNCLTCRR